MARVSFKMSDVQHKEWFIVTLVPHIRQPLMQQNIVTQSTSLEIAMKLEASLVGVVKESILCIGFKRPSTY